MASLVSVRDQQLVIPSELYEAMKEPSWLLVIREGGDVYLRKSSYSYYPKYTGIRVARAILRRSFSTVNHAKLVGINAEQVEFKIPRGAIANNDYHIINYDPFYN